MSDTLINWLSLTAKFLNNKEEEEEEDDDWLCPMLPQLSNVNDEATNLCAYAAARRVVWVPMHKIPDNLPWHFRLPTQGNPNLWVVCVKVQLIIHELYEGSHIVAWLWGSPHFSAHPSLHAPWQWYLSPTCNRISIFPPQYSGFCIHRRSTMRCHGCCLRLGNRIPMTNTGTLGRMLNITLDLQPTLLWYPQGRMGALSLRVIPWWHWHHLWVQ